MLLNYLKLSLRLLIRNPFFTLINVLGLSISFAVFFVLWQHATYELQSDRFHKDYERIYRAYCDFRFAEGEYWNNYVFSSLPPVLATLLKEKNSEIEDFTRLIHQRNFDAVRWKGPQTDTSDFSQLTTKVILSYINQYLEKISFKETRSAFADPNFFEFFSMPLVQGQPNRVLDRADAVVLSQSTAKKYFGQQDPIGKTLILNDEKSFTVTGVFKDPGSNTHLNVDLLFSTLHISKAVEGTDPYQETAVCYFKTSKDGNIPKLEKALDDESALHWNHQEYFPGSVGKSHFQPLTESAFQIFENDSYAPKSKIKLQILLVVGIVVLAMAWINYLNLKLSTQTARMKELATRKTAGARITDFIKQFLVESVLINILSMLVAVTLVQILKSPLEILFQLHVPDWIELKIQTLVIFLVAMVVGILIAALHPALTMWKLTVHSMLHFGKVFSDGRSFTTVTSILQFVIAITLMVWLGMVFSQVNFVLNNSWGINRDGVIVVDLPADNTIEGRQEHIEELKNELRQLSGVVDLTTSTTVSGDVIRNRIGFFRQDSYFEPKSDGGVDERFIPFYKLTILAGRNFSPENPADRKAVILSREAAQSVGWEPEEAIGKKLWVEKYPSRPFTWEAEVIGVIEDHRYTPLYLQTTIANANRGTLLTYSNYLFKNNLPEKMSIRVNGSNDVIEKIKSKFEQIYPGTFFHWYFLDAHMNAHYQRDRIARNQITLFTSIAIGIACLGLLGVIANKAVSKTKEIGIRKVLGAQLHQIGQILLYPTLRQIIVAVIIGTPLAYFLTEFYLQNFSERVAIQFWHFVMPILLLILIMLSSVAWVVFRAARKNPVQALKYE